MLLEVSPPFNSARFLCEVSVASKVDAVLSHVVQLFNLRLKLAARTGAGGCDPPAGESHPRTLVTGKKRASEEAFSLAAALLSQTSVRQKLVVTPDQLNDALSKCEALDADECDDDLQLVLESNAGLFFAGKWLEAERRLSDYVGRNEKTKVSLSLCTSGVPPNARGVSSLQHQTAELPVAPDLKDGICAIPAPGPGIPEAGQSLSAFFRSKARPKMTVETVSVHTQEEAEEEEEAKLSAAQAERLCSSAAVFAALANQRLQTLVREIDGSATRDLALRRLETALGLDPASLINRFRNQYATHGTPIVCS